MCARAVQPYVKGHAVLRSKQGRESRGRGRNPQQLWEELGKDMHQVCKTGNIPFKHTEGFCDTLEKVDLGAGAVGYSQHDVLQQDKDLH